MTQHKPLPAFFINAFYESKFRDTLFVVKASGDVIEDDTALDSLICNIRDLTLHGIKILLVYGGGKAVDRAVEARGIGTKRQDGRRVTDGATLDVMREVIGGTMSLRVYESMSRNYLEGLCFNAVPAEWMKVDLRAKEPVDYGFVGDIKGVNKRPIMRKFKLNDFIACPCLAMSQDGQLCNINADTIATALAVGISANKLVFLSNIDGVKVNGETAFMITSTQIRQYIEDGTVTDGMKVKMENCLHALEGGVKRIHLINGLRADALYKEIFEPVGPGTMLLQDSERQNYLNEVEVQKIIGGNK
ncbi:MAG: acetylglutamate kinase [Alphaproteobacteria bacterium]|nr:acetylglutamate kinase [Alphaproteobacteria bacterium]